MKIRNSSRITAIVLALVMLLPLISIPTFAVEADEILYSEDFTSYAGLEDDAMQAKLKANWNYGNVAKNVQAVTEGDNTYLRFPMASAIPEGSEFLTDIYLYDNYTKWNNTDGTKQFVPSSFDPETNKLTFTQAEGDDLVLDVTPSETEGLYGTVSYAGHTWTVATGEYAACQKFGDGYAIDKWSHILFGESELYTAEDPEVQANTKKVGDVKKYTDGFSYKDHDKVVVKYKLFIEENSSGVHNMQLNFFANASTPAGSYNQNFLELGNLELSTGKWTGGSLAGATLPIGEWVEIAYIVDLKNATVQGVLDGTAYGIVSAGAKGTGGITISGWTLTKIFKQNPANLAGGLCVDDVQVLPGSTAGSLIKFKPYVNNFESANVGDVAPGFSSMNALNKVAEWKGNKVWAHGSSNDGTGVKNDNTSKLANPMFNSDMGDNLVLSVDYYVPYGTSTRLQTQLYPNCYTAIDKNNGTIVNGNWGDVYVINSYNGVLSLGREGNVNMFTLPYDEWFTVAVEFTFSTNTFDVYVDGNFVFGGQQVRDYTSLMSINANGILIAKELDAAASWNTGYTYIDNISMTEGVYEDAFSGDAKWTEDDMYADLMTFVADPDLQEDDYNPNTEVADNAIFAADNAYSFPSTLIFVDDGDWTPDAIQLNIASTAVADDPETEEDETVAEGAVDKMVRPLHVGISAKKASTIVLSANYTVSEDAAGKIESELFDTGTWMSLFRLDADTSTINGVAFTKGEQFNITVVMDTVAGVAYVYYNNLLINVVKNAKIANGLNVGEWSVAKIMKYCDTYAGNVIVDDMTITCKLAEEKAQNPLYLYESGEKATNIIETVDAASIRLKDPTGLRFATQVNAALLDVADEVGMIIAPANYVTAAGEFTTEALDTLGYKTNYIKVQAGDYYDNQNSTAVLPTSNHKYITASIVNILDTNIAREFAAIGYYVIDGVTYYADAYTVRSVQAVADAVIESNEFAEDADVMAVLNKYASAN